MAKKNAIITIVLFLVVIFVIGCGSTVSTIVASWSAQTSPTTQQLNKVFFYDSSNGWIAADNGLILKTTNEGTTWTTYEADADGYNQRAIYFLSTQEGYVAGAAGRIYKSTNGGANWSNQIAGAVSDTFFDIVMVGSSTGCAVGNDGIYSYDGSTWAVESGVSISETLYGLTYNSSSTRYYTVGQDGKIMYSNAGPITSTWTDQTSPTTEALKAVTFTGATNGWIVGDNGLILKTTNSGTNWTTVESGVSVNLRGIAFSSSQEGWIVGNTGTILYTADGGTNWNNQSSGTTEDLIDVYALSGQSRAWAVGANGTILSYQ